MDIKRSILPGACFFCLSTTTGAWCIRCERDFILDIERCPICARRSKANKTCGSCLKQLPIINSTEVLFDYQYPTNYLIKAYKFKNRPELAERFSVKLTEKLKNKSALPELLLPVPLHRTKQRQRGYNQSLELAKKISQSMQIKVESSLCQRIRNTSPQSTLPTKNRRANVKGAFKLKSRHMPEHVAIIDDVITTGSTVNELAKHLKRAGCKTIEAWAIARA